MTLLTLKIQSKILVKGFMQTTNLRLDLTSKGNVWMTLWVATLFYQT